jgi:prevent-host-death family protein
MKTIESYEVKSHFSTLLNEVARGETITIAKQGTPIAQLVPVRQKELAAKAIAEVKEMRTGVTTGGISIREMIEEGRRY